MITQRIQFFKNIFEYLIFIFYKSSAYIVLLLIDFTINTESIQRNDYIIKHIM